MRIKKNQMNYYFLITLGLNLTSIVMGILYFVIGPDLIFGFLFSIILVISWFLDIGLILLDDFKLAKNNATGKILNRLGYGFVCFQIFGVFCMVGGLFLLNADWTSPLVQYPLIFISFFGFFLFGSILAYLNIKKLDIPEAWNFE
ncbi:MAG: hypothetical protein KAX10_10690 [Candidatus Lokiarchaeota archaeon]|nr:hypothetical protein [Candidatus Lokiarchaeota archaeon]